MSTALASPLAHQVADELGVAAPPAARALTNAILERHDRNETIAGVLFYGSCLRKSTHEGVLDFYLLVDDYQAFYSSRPIAWANGLLPPNVFYLEAETQLGTLRTKYAVISLEDFEHCVGPDCVHPYIWARFAQPSILVYVRDEESRQRVIACAAQAVKTLIQRLGVFLPARGAIQKFSIAALWQEAFRRTYGAEKRPESSDTIRSIYQARSERYDAAGASALVLLDEEGWFESVVARGSAFEVELRPSRRLWTRWRWRFSRPVARGLAVLRLLKTAFTFGDWVPYALWKFERHTGEAVEVSERQRRHPLIFGWPVIWRVLLRR
ncbi:MAG: hypothetical protein JRH19_01635 [Deltaproteobacteria bacterium]|nr:hypothetical protein [Deltaproteobacteria bacterium]